MTVQLGKLCSGANERPRILHQRQVRQHLLQIRSVGLPVFRGVEQAVCIVEDVILGDLRPVGGAEEGQGVVGDVVNPPVLPDDAVLPASQHRGQQISLPGPILVILRDLLIAVPGEELTRVGSIEGQIRQVGHHQRRERLRRPGIHHVEAIVLHPRLRESARNHTRTVNPPKIVICVDLVERPVDRHARLTIHELDGLPAPESLLQG